MKSTWTIDPGHSEIQFKVRHLAIANVTGTFKIFSGSVECSSEGFDNASVEFEIDSASIDTNNSERDKHLKSDAFFTTDKFPKINFRGVLKKSGDDYKLSGDLKILETIKQVILNVEHFGVGSGRFNDTRAGFEALGKINRKDFGLNFHLLNEAGNLVVGDEVKIQCNIELIRQ